MTSINVRKNRSKVKIDPSKAIVKVTRSNKNVYAQLLEPVTRKTLAGVHTVKLKGTKTERSLSAGKQLAKAAKSAGYESVAFDRNGRLFHGRVAAVAQGLKEEGITI